MAPIQVLVPLNREKHDDKTGLLGRFFCDSSLQALEFKDN